MPKRWNCTLVTDSPGDSDRPSASLIASLPWCEPGKCAKRCCNSSIASLSRGSWCSAESAVTTPPSRLDRQATSQTARAGLTRSDAVVHLEVILDVLADDMMFELGRMTGAAADQGERDGRRDDLPGKGRIRGGCGRSSCQSNGPRWAANAARACKRCLPASSQACCRRRRARTYRVADVRSSPSGARSPAYGRFHRSRAPQPG